MDTRQLTEPVILDLDFATREQIEWLREHGSFHSDKEVIEAAVRALSQDICQLQEDQDRREELSRFSNFKPYDIA